MEAAILLFAMIVIFAAAGVMFWAMYRSESLANRLHPLTPEQRRRKRQVYVVMIPIYAVGIVVAAVIASGGVGAVVMVVILAAILLLDALLTPWLHYRRAKRKATPS